MGEMTERVEIRKREDFSISYDHVKDCLVLFDGKKKIQHRATFSAIVNLLWNIELEELELEE